MLLYVSSLSSRSRKIRLLRGCVCGRRQPGPMAASVMISRNNADVFGRTVFVLRLCSDTVVG